MSTSPEAVKQALLEGAGSNQPFLTAILSKSTLAEALALIEQLEERVEDLKLELLDTCVRME